MLLPQREELLSELGVTWSRARSTHDAQWDACFAQLMDFRRREGHCMVRVHVQRPHGVMACSNRVMRPPC